ncbi:hypothetical protein [Mesorhizobium amorphae]|uniref:hypothetical protein n=1 Tax=Mesorhizobium amorphae TaxID=71433 RepID=UPI0016434666|nr:hypothetical protein [Mesorhizobium amorphae]
MWAFLTSKLGVYVVCGAAITAFLSWTHYEMYETGRRYERSAMLNRSVIILRERIKTDAAVSAMDDAGLCAALGGGMSDAGVCE